MDCLSIPSLLGFLGNIIGSWTVTGAGDVLVILANGNTIAFTYNHDLYAFCFAGVYI